MKQQGKSAPFPGERRSIGYYLQKFSAALFLLLMVVVMSVINENFFELNNMFNISKQIAILGVMSVAQTFVIMTGGIDLSVGSNVSLTGCVMALLSVNHHWPVPAAILAGVAVGTLCGLVNGLVVEKGRIPPFIATLGMLSVAEGSALLITEGRLISGTSPILNFLGGARLFDVVPISPLVFIAVALLGWILLSKTVFGRNLYAIGGNEGAAKRSGIPVGRSKIFVYVLSGFICSIAGILIVGRLKSASGLMASGMELNTVAATCLGGASMTGGYGNMSGTIIGVLTIGVLNNCLNLLNISTFVQQIVLGIMIVSVVIFDTIRNRRLKD